MAEAKKISEEFSFGGQPTPEDLKHLADEGFKSVINLRFSDETGVLVDEQQQAEAVGLQYLNLPLSSSSADAELTAKTIAEIEQLPRPVYFHCGSGGRASAAALIAFATQQKLNQAAVLAKATEMGINPEQPQLKQFLDSIS